MFNVNVRTRVWSSIVHEFEMHKFGLPNNLSKFGQT